MRINRLAILLLLVGCKAATPVTDSASGYAEDLSIHRPVILPQNSEVNSQQEEEVSTEPYVPMQGHIRTALDSISKIALAENKAGKYVDGFVIQVYSGNEREVANEALIQMQQNFPDLNPSMSYRQPNFRVKAGRFTNRLEANRVYIEVKNSFSKALLIPERFLLKYE